MKGLRPSLVNIQLGDNSWFSNEWQEWETYPFILIEAVDVIERIDFRFIVNLVVAVGGDDGNRVESLFNACIKAGAARVIGSAQFGREVRYLDSKGVFSWQE